MRRAAGAYAADRHIQDVAGNGAAVVACHCVHLKGRIEHGGVDLHLDGGLARRLRHFHTVGVPADAVGSEVLAAQLCGKGVGIAQHGLAGAADMHGSRCKHGGHVHVLLEVRIGAGLLGHAVAPLDEHIAVLRHSRHADGLGGAGHFIGEGCLAAVAAAGKGAAGLVHPVAGLIQHTLLFGRACSLRAAGCCHRRAGVRGILGAGGDVGGVGPTVVGLVSVGAQIAQHGLQAHGLQVDIAGLVVILAAIAVGILQRFGAVEELQAHLLTHGQQGHVEVVDLGLVHVGVVCVVCRHRRHRVHDDVGVGVAFLNGLHQRGVVLDELVHAHAGIVGAQHDDHAAGLHFGHGLRDGVGAAVLFKGNDALVQGGMGANALLGAELLQADQAVGVQAHRVGIAEEQRFLLVALARVGSLRQQGGRGLADLVVIRDILFARHQHLAGGLFPRGCRGLAALEQRHGNGNGQNGCQRAHTAHQHSLLLHRSKRLLFRSCISHISHHSLSFRYRAFRSCLSVQDLVCKAGAAFGQQHRVEGFQLFPAAVAVQRTGGIQPAVRSAAHVVVAVAHHQHPPALHHGLGQHMAHHVGLGVAALVHGRAADKIKIACKALFFQNGRDDLRGLGGSGAQHKARILQALQHLGCTGVGGALVAALDGVAVTVKVRGLFNEGRVGKVLTKALAQRRAKVAAQVHICGVHAHPGKDFF